MRLRVEARTIREKYLAPPHTTDFAILFVPTEGLYAEALRRPGLFESLQREHRVMLAGPTTLAGDADQPQIGFARSRSRSGRPRCGRCWRVKTEFGKFGHVLANVKRQANDGRQLDRRGRDADAPDGARAARASRRLPELRVQTLLPGSWVDNADVDDDADD